MKSMISVAAIGALVGFALVASPATAAECNGTVTQLDTPAGTFYVDDRESTGQNGGVWVYEESNGVAGMQSGGASILLGEDDRDFCEHGLVDENGRPLPADTLLL